MARITVSDDLSEAVDGATWVQESIVENIEAKRGLFARLDRTHPRTAQYWPARVR